MTASTFNPIELALTSAAVAGDAGGLYRMAAEMMEGGVSFDSLLFDYLIPIAGSVGKRWEQGDYLVAEEHAATAAIETVISLLSGTLDQPPGAPLVVVATAEGDDHSLPARAAASHLLYSGYRTTFLGANVPGADLGEFLVTEPPSAVVLSCAMTTHLMGARSVIKAAHEVGVPVVVGGKAFGPAGIWAGSVGADAWVGSLRQTSAVVAEWVRTTPTALNLTSELPGELSSLVRVRAAVIADAGAALMADTDGQVPTRLEDEIDLLLSAIEGALLTGDDRVVTDMLAWQASSLAAHGLDGSIVVAALQKALNGSSTQGGALLSQAWQALQPDIGHPDDRLGTNS